MTRFFFQYLLTHNSLKSHSVFLIVRSAYFLLCKILNISFADVNFWNVYFLITREMGVDFFQIQWGVFGDHEFCIGFTQFSMSQKIWGTNILNFSDFVQNPYSVVYRNSIWRIKYVSYLWFDTKSVFQIFLGRRSRFLRLPS